MVRNIVAIAIIVLCVVWGRWLWKRAKRIWPGPANDSCDGTEQRDRYDSSDP